MTVMWKREADDVVRASHCVLSLGSEYWTVGCAGRCPRRCGSMCCGSSQPARLARRDSAASERRFCDEKLGWLGSLSGRLKLDAVRLQEALLRCSDANHRLRLGASPEPAYAVQQTASMHTRLRSDSATLSRYNMRTVCHDSSCHLPTQQFATISPCTRIYETLHSRSHHHKTEFRLQCRPQLNLKLAFRCAHAEHASVPPPPRISSQHRGQPWFAATIPVQS